MLYYIICYIILYYIMLYVTIVNLFSHVLWPWRPLFGPPREESLLLGSETRGLLRTHLAKSERMWTKRKRSEKRLRPLHHLVDSKGLRLDVRSVAVLFSVFRQMVDMTDAEEASKRVYVKRQRARLSR